MELELKKVNIKDLMRGICPRCGRLVSHLVEPLEGMFADVYRCNGGGHVYVVPIVKQPKNIVRS